MGEYAACSGRADAGVLAATAQGTNASRPEAGMMNGSGPTSGSATADSAISTSNRASPSHHQTQVRPG